MHIGLRDVQQQQHYMIEDSLWKPLCPVVLIISFPSPSFSFKWLMSLFSLSLSLFFKFLLQAHASLAVSRMMLSWILLQRSFSCFYSLRLLTSVRLFLFDPLNSMFFLLSYLDCGQQNEKKKMSCRH